MLGSGPPSFVHALFALDPGCWTPLAQQKQAAPPVPVVLAQLSMHPASPIGLLPKPFSQLFTHASYWQHADSVLPKSVAAVRTLVKCAVTARIRFTYPSMCRVLRGRPGRCWSGRWGWRCGWTSCWCWRLWSFGVLFALLKDLSRLSDCDAVNCRK
jgi:hypothetical protein